nr:response regulator [Desulfobacula sp.]
MNLRIFRSIRLIMLVLVTIAVLPSLSGLIYFGFEARNKAMRDAEQETLRLVQSMAATQERITASTKVLLTTLTLAPSVDRLDLPACNELFSDIVKLNPLYTNILMADPNGDIIASAIPYPPTNLADRKHFRDACLTKEFSTGEYIISRTTFEPAFPFSYPLLDEAGRVKAVLIAAIRLKHYSELFQNNRSPRVHFWNCRSSRTAALSNSYSRRRIRSGETHCPSSLERGDHRRGKRRHLSGRFGQGPPYPVIQQAGSGAGNPGIYVYVCRHSREGPGKKCKRHLVQKRRDCRWFMASGLAPVMGDRPESFFDKIKRLTNSVSRFGSGDFSKPTGVDHNAGELGRVAEAFDRMADKLRRVDTERERLQQQLTQAQKLESVGRLAGGVAHDFNNMLMVILGHTGMLLEDISAEDPNRTNLEAIHQAARKSADLTRQLLTFARRQTIAPVVLDLNDTIAGMLKMIQRLIGENIRTIWIPETAPWPVRMDPAQIDQVLANLAVNARDAIDGTGAITIKTSNITIDADYCTDHLECVPGDYVMLSVSDDGCGMDKETQARLFEPFFTTKGLGKGTGLGLATIYGVVKQNKGFIRVYSEAGKGTSFKIYFPRHVGEISDKDEHRQAETPKGQGELILLVEDDISILPLGRAMLERLGYQVITAATPGEALACVTSLAHPIRLLITDVIMPEMNGRELADRIREIHPDVKCLYMSGYTSDIITHQGVLDEGVRFIEKPFTAKALAEKVRQILDMQTG